MDQRARETLEAVSRGELSPQDALERMRTQGFFDLGDFARIDHDRVDRCGLPEVVFAWHKTFEQVRDILLALYDAHGRALATRVAEPMIGRLQEAFLDAAVNEQARTVRIGANPAPRPGAPPVLVVAAGTSDLPVAEEACEAARFAGCAVDRLYDVGVAGLHRVLAERKRLRRAGAIVVVAGMEGALPSVVGGLVAVPVVAVPTSVGYGASFGGLAALLGMLNSCAAGVTVVNIDNGFGAGVAVARAILGTRRSEP